MDENPPDRGVQTATTRSGKARLIRRIVKAVREEGLTYDQWRYVVKRVRHHCDLRPTRQPKRLPRVLSDADFRKFYQAVDRADDVQHAVMLRLLFFTGVRVSELTRIEVKDVDFEACKIRVEQGKGSKDRYVLFGRSFATTLRSHIAAHPKNRWVFQTQRKSHFSVRRVQEIVSTYARRAGIEATPHTFRHQAITWLTRHSGLADAELQLITGHAQRKTLEKYQHIAFDDALMTKYQAGMKEIDL